MRYNLTHENEVKMRELLTKETIVIVGGTQSSCKPLKIIFAASGTAFGAGLIGAVFGLGQGIDSEPGMNLLGISMCCMLFSAPVAVIAGCVIAGNLIVKKIAKHR